MSEPLEGTCTCGDVFDEHGGDLKFSGSTACNVEGCDCVAYEEASDDEDEGDEDDDDDDDEALE